MDRNKKVILKKPGDLVWIVPSRKCPSLVMIIEVFSSKPIEDIIIIDYKILYKDKLFLVRDSSVATTKEEAKKDYLCWIEIP